MSSLISRKTIKSLFGNEYDLIEKEFNKNFDINAKTYQVFTVCVEIGQLSEQ